MKAATFHFVVGRALTYYDSVADPANAMKKEWMDFYFEWNKLINVFAIGMLVIDFVWLIINGVDWIWSGQPEENPLLQGYQSVITMTFLSEYKRQASRAIFSSIII